MEYADFVNDMYECIKEYSCCQAFSMAVFAEGPSALEPAHTVSQEYAVLRNEYAKDFYDVIVNNPQLFAPNSNFCELEKSRIIPDEVKVTHSCYPKNIRRWMKGILSRKQKCRAELCALIWCWYEYWMEDICSQIDKEAFGKSLLSICHKYTAYGDEFSMDVLWNSCTFVYWKTLGRLK